MLQIKFLLAFLAVLTIVVLADAYDCMSGKFSGPCFFWNTEHCRRLCTEEGRVSGHCSPALACWCEGC
ncbi:hypothetical protein KR084_010553 [Drosophila pseudotakahashii]|nr:hypothetical protein KR084_010553 [Drosophila pseudotakahashii]